MPTYEGILTDNKSTGMSHGGHEYWRPGKCHYEAKNNAVTRGHEYRHISLPPAGFPSAFPGGLSMGVVGIEVDREARKRRDAPDVYMTEQPCVIVALGGVVASYGLLFISLPTLKF